MTHEADTWEALTSMAPSHYTPWIEDARDWADTEEKFSFCIDLLQISAHNPNSDLYVRRLEAEFAHLLKRDAATITATRTAGGTDYTVTSGGRRMGERVAVCFSLDAAKALCTGMGWSYTVSS